MRKHQFFWTACFCMNLKCRALFEILKRKKLSTWLSHAKAKVTSTIALASTAFSYFPMLLPFIDYIIHFLFFQVVSIIWVLLVLFAKARTLIGPMYFHKTGTTCNFSICIINTGNICWFLVVLSFNWNGWKRLDCLRNSEFSIWTYRWSDERYPWIVWLDTIYLKGRRSSCRDASDGAEGKQTKVCDHLKNTSLNDC